MHSDKRTAQLLFAAALEAGIEDIVFSPGSRNAPLIIEHFNWPLNARVIPEERVAAFTALGMAQQSRKPVMLVCTSGSAVLNYYPAVAEAFYSKIPLIIVSADRPPYRIDKGEGQTIRQKGVLKNHIHFEADLSLDGGEEEILTLLTRAFETAWDKKGPVHINIPFEEPLYDIVEEVSLPSIKMNKQTRENPLSDADLDEAEKIWRQAGRKMIIVSQNDSAPVLQKQLEKLATFDDTVVLTENIANVKSDLFFENIDRLIFPFDNEEWEKFAPDLVITIGNNIISKKIKYLLRAIKPPLGHWHIGREVIAPDTFDKLKKHFNLSPSLFLSQFLFRIYDYEPVSDYAGMWRKLNKQRKKNHDLFLKEIRYGDMAVYKALESLLHPPYQVQWGNSTVIRYAQLFNFQEGIKHFSNRGTSGIDGSLSTAVGAAWRTGTPVLAVIGDLSFQYDSNALWQEIPENLKIIVINNGGGDIFRFIPGPARVKGFEDFFVVKQKRKFEKLAGFYQLSYQFLDANTARGNDIMPEISNFLSNDTKILEVDTSGTPNAEILKKYFRNLNRA